MSSLTISQDFSQDTFKEYQLDKYFSIQSVTAGTRMHVAGLIFDQKLQVDNTKNPSIEILTSKCWSESIQKKNKVPSLTTDGTLKLFYSQKIILCPQNNSIVDTECDCFVRHKKCKHSAASMLLLGHKRRHNLPVNDAPNTPQDVTTKLLQNANTRIQELEELLKQKEEETATLNKSATETADKEVQSQQDLPSPLPTHDETFQRLNDEPLFTPSDNEELEERKPSFLTPMKTKRKKIHPFLFQEFVSSQEGVDSTDFIVDKPTPNRKRQRSPQQQQSRSKSVTISKLTSPGGSAKPKFTYTEKEDHSASPSPQKRNSTTKSSIEVELSQNLRRTIRSLIEQDEDEDYIDEQQILRAQAKKSPKKRSLFDFDVREEEKSRKRKRSNKEIKEGRVTTAPSPKRKRRSLLAAPTE